MFLITGAAGKTGKAILRKLTEKGQLIKALVFRFDQVSEVEVLGAKEVIVGDMRNLEIVRRALQGVDSIYHICPNVHPDEITIGQSLIDAAAKVGIEHFVYHSVLHPQIEAMPHHWKKMRVEEFLFESGLPYTILQPAIYMQNILVNWENIIMLGQYTVPYSVESRLSMVDLEDVARAARTILMDGSDEGNHHAGATYELVGTPAISQTEIAALLSEHLNCPVFAESVSIDYWIRNIRPSNMGDYQTDTLVKMFDYYNKYGLSGNSNVLSYLLNGPTTKFDAFVKRVINDKLRYVQ